MSEIQPHSMIIDNSAIERWQRCPRAWQYSSLQQRLGIRSLSLAFGSFIHDALAAYFSWPVADLPRLEPTLRASADRWALSSNPNLSHLTLGHGLLVLREHIEDLAGQAPWEVYIDKDGPFVERTLVGQLVGQPYCGTLDLVIRQRDALWLVDHKTAAFFGQNWIQQQQSTGQYSGYIALARSHGLNLAGVLVNGICNAERPAKPRKPFQRTCQVEVPFDAHRERAYLESLEQVLGAMYESEEEHQLHHAQLPRYYSACIGKYGPCEYWNVCHTPGVDEAYMLREQCVPNEFEPWRPKEVLKPSAEPVNL